MSANPVYDRLVAHSRPPSLRTTLIVGGVLLIASVVGTALWMAATPHLLDEYDASGISRAGVEWTFQLADQVATAVLWLYGVLALVTLGVARFLAAREVQSEAFAILKTTGLKPQVIASGLMKATLFRLRVPLALVIVMTPLVAVSQHQRDVRLIRQGCVVFMSPGEERVPDILHGEKISLPCAEPDDPRINWLWLFIVPGLVTAAGGILMAAAMGTSLMLWLRSPLATLTSVIAIAALVVALLTVIGPFPGLRFMQCTNKCTVGIDWPPVDLVYGLVIPAVPFVLAWVAIRTAHLRPG